MIKTTFHRLLAFTATAGLAASLAACGPDDAQQNKTVAPLLSQASPQPGWSMDDLAAVDPQFLTGEATPLPEAVPMRASYRGDYGYAPAYDYGPEYVDEGYFDDGYYADNVGADDYQWLALAAALGGMLGNAPPDYAFGYGGVQPWAWETGDRYLRYAEPIDGGYRYYYYEPDSYTPFLVSDPYYSYGYRDDRLVAIYDRSGRVLDARRAERQRQAARDYYARARQMYVAAHREPRVGVAAPLWQRQRDAVVRQQRRWDEARGERKAWQTWDAKNEPRLHRDWAGEALVRREAERSFAGWQKADFKTPAPKFYSPQQRQAQLQKVAQIRRNEQAAGGRRSPQQPALVQRQAVQGRPAMQRQQQRVVAEQRRQVSRQADALRARGQRQAQTQRAAQQRQAQAQRAEDRQRSQAARQKARKAQQQHQAQAQRANVQQQERRQRAQQLAGRVAQQRKQAAAQQHQQQALHAAQQRRQQAAREHQLEAQRATQQRQAAHAQQAQRAARQEAQRATQQRQAARAQQVHQAAQQQAQRAASQRAAAQQQQAQARQAQRQAQPSHAARRQPSGGGQSQQAHGNGHGRKDR
jgi:hypothetical protein